MAALGGTLEAQGQHDDPKAFRLDLVSRVKSCRPKMRRCLVQGHSFGEPALGMRGRSRDGRTGGGFGPA